MIIYCCGLCLNLGSNISLCVVHLWCTKKLICETLILYSSKLEGYVCALDRA